jgi:DNA topoisomerase-3
VRCRPADHRQAKAGRRRKTSATWRSRRQRRRSLSANACDRRFADSLARQKRTKPPAGYKTSISICRAFLNQHAPKKKDGETAGRVEAKPASPAQLLYAEKIAQGKRIIIPDEVKANSAAMSAWIDLNRGTKRRKPSRKIANEPASRRS